MANPRRKPTAAPLFGQQPTNWLAKAVAQAKEQQPAPTSDNPLDWANQSPFDPGVVKPPRGNVGVYPAFPPDNPHYPGVAGMPGPSIPETVRGVAPWHPPYYPGGGPTATAKVPPPNYGDPNHLPGGAPSATATGPPPRTTTGVTTTGTTIPSIDVPWVDTSRFTYDPKQIQWLTKQVMAAMKINYPKLTKTATKAAKAVVAQNVAELVRQQNQIRA